jgi:hypothetical protein
VDTETAGESAPRESTPVIRPEQNREHDSARRNEPEGRNRTFEDGESHRDPRSSRNSDREPAMDSTAPSPEGENNASDNSRRDFAQSNQQEENQAPFNPNSGEPTGANPPASTQSPGGGQGQQRRDQGRPRFPRRDRGRGRRGPTQRLPERQGGGDRSPERRGEPQQRESRQPRDREFDQAPAPVRQKSGSALAEAVFEVDRIRQVLEGVLQDMEHVLGQLEQAEADQTASEQEIESLRRSLESLHRSTHLPRS